MKLKLIYLIPFIVVLIFVLALVTRAGKTAIDFLENPEYNLSSTLGRTNILFLGVSGGEHEGGDLTDTMIFASVDIKTADTVMISLPRDIWIEPMVAKINTAFHYGEESSSGGGFALVRQAVELVTGQPVHYIFLVDFSGFRQAIDLVGGIEVRVARSFDDYKYPIPGKENDDCGGDEQYKCRFQHIHFDAGLRNMDGETALKFVRSRNAEGDEGTDFARSARQQQVIEALGKKIISRPLKWNTFLSIVSNYVVTDQPLEQEKQASFANLFVRFMTGKREIRTLTLDTGSQENPGLLVNPPIDLYGQWVLVPTAGDWGQVQDFISKKIENLY